MEVVEGRVEIVLIAIHFAQARIDKPRTVVAAGGVEVVQGRKVGLGGQAILRSVLVDTSPIVVGQRAEGVVTVAAVVVEGVAEERVVVGVDIVLVEGNGMGQGVVGTQPTTVQPMKIEPLKQGKGTIGLVGPRTVEEVEHDGMDS